MMLKKDIRGFTIMGLFWALFTITLLAAIVGGIVYAFYYFGHAPTLEGDLREVQTAVTDYVTASSAAGMARWPTADGKLPPPNEYALINFLASFQDSTGNTLRFYPHFLKDLPRHWNSGVWRIDSNSRVSVNMKPEEY